jgi:hypothetical protein
LRKANDRDDAAQFVNQANGENYHDKHMLLILLGYGNNCTKFLLNCEFKISGKT